MRMFDSCLIHAWLMRVSLNRLLRHLDWVWYEIILQSTVFYHHFMELCIYHVLCFKDMKNLNPRMELEREMACRSS